MVISGVLLSFVLQITDQLFDCLNKCALQKPKQREEKNYTWFTDWMRLWPPAGPLFKVCLQLLYDLDLKNHGYIQRSSILDQY